jgi:hypothetical protein
MRISDVYSKAGHWTTILSLAIPYDILARTLNKQGLQAKGLQAKGLQAKGLNIY